METTFTPGPWHVGQGNGVGNVFADEGRMRLESAGTTLYPICSVIDFDGERETNAQLIAAAPELAKFADMVLGLLETFPDGRNVRWDIVARDAREVLAKATGKDGAA